MRLLPRHGHVHFASDSRRVPPASIDSIAAGDRVYLNCGGRLVPITLVTRNEHHCVGRVSTEIRHEAAAGETVEFDIDDIYVVQRRGDLE